MISGTRVVPMLDSKGEKSRARPAFTDEELESLIAFVPSWIESSYTARTRQMRILCSAYIEFLVNTGIRHGTEALPLRWKHLQWHWIGDKKYLRIWVSGKTGPRWLIAKHRAVDVLRRLHARQQDIAHIPFDDLFEQQLDLRVFRASDGTTYTRMDSTWLNPAHSHCHHDPSP